MMCFSQVNVEGVSCQYTLPGAKLYKKIQFARSVFNENIKRPVTDVLTSAFSLSSHYLLTSFNCYSEIK